MDALMTISRILLWAGFAGSIYRVYASRKVDPGQMLLWATLAAGLLLIGTWQTWGMVRYPLVRPVQVAALALLAVSLLAAVLWRQLKKVAVIVVAVTAAFSLANLGLTLWLR